MTPIHTRKIQTWWLFQLVAAFAAAAVCFGAQGRPPQEQDSDKRERQDGLRGLDLAMDGDLESAVRIAQGIQHRYPQSPLGYLVEADATWWRIYYSIGDLIDPDVFDVGKGQGTPYDGHLEDMVNSAISKSEARIRAHEDEARNTLYEGLAYAVRGRLTGLEGEDLATARAGKKMRSLLLRALELDPNLVDAYAGLGNYNYYVDTLPTIVKLLKFLIALPGGSREVGLQQLHEAAEKGELVRGETDFFLAKNLSRQSEKQYAKSLELFQELAQKYPHNPLWTLVIGSLRCRLNQAHECEAIYREVLKKTGDGNAEVMKAVHSAAREAILRRHPSEQLH
jgi:tetratricopeptide (TPR) repeat protein